MANTDRAQIRTAIHARIRRKVRGSDDKPRLAIYRSLNHIYAQVIDDRKGQTLVSASSTEKELRTGTGGNLDAARAAGLNKNEVVEEAAAETEEPPAPAEQPAEKKSKKKKQE
jgi:large subunit ribosomal protein L18